MRDLLSLAICSAVALPGAARAQDVLHLTRAPAASPATAAPALAPLPTVEPTVSAPPPMAAAPPPPPVQDAVAPTPPTEPAKVAPVIVAKEEKEGLGDKLGTIAGGVAGGAAGAAVAGPVGKFAGGFLGKKLAKGLFGDDKDKVPEITVVEVPPSAETAAKAAVADPATAPPLTETASAASPS